MNTSYLKKSHKHPNAVAICLSVPPWAGNIRIYPKLSPTAFMLYAYKNKYMTEAEYTEMYNDLILDNLDPQETYDELGKDAVLLCWENVNAGLFCHRTLVAKWFKDQLGIDILELE